MIFSAMKHSLPACKEHPHILCDTGIPGIDDWNIQTAVSQNLCIVKNGFAVSAFIAAAQEQNFRLRAFYPFAGLL